MQQDDNNDLAILLSRRAAPPDAAPDLAERIIRKAMTQMRENPRAQNLWNELLAMFAIPHPSVAVAAGIILGLMVGVQASDGLTVLQQDWSSFLYVNEGGWL